MNNECLIEAIGIEKNFGGIRALDGCSIRGNRQSITGLIGPNGAGKTTLFNLISGYYKPDRGEVYLAGRRIDGLAPHRIVRRGLARTFQIPRELREMTVLENMMLFPQQQRGEKIRFPLFAPGRMAEQERELREKAEARLEFVQLIDLKDELAKNLSGGQKKLLELARKSRAGRSYRSSGKTDGGLPAPRRYPTSSMPSLSIIVPVLNEAARVEAALQRLRAQAPEAEIVVVDGGSRDGTAAGWPDPCSRPPHFSRLLADGLCARNMV